MAREIEQLIAMGSRLRQLRKPIPGTDPVRYEITQPQVAEIAGITLRAYQAWEGGESTPDLENLKPVAKFLGADPYWILVGDREPSQLDRVEAKLDAVITHLGIELDFDAADEAMAALTTEATTDAQQPRSTSSATRGKHRGEDG